jgi:hypothetical protein
MLLTPVTAACERAAVEKLFEQVAEAAEVSDVSAAEV